MARALLLLLAAVGLGVAVVRTHDDRACERAQRGAFAVGLGGSAADAGAVVRRVADDCTGGAALAAAATALLRGRQLDDAARLARTAIARDPEDYRGWSALAAVRSAQGDAGGAAAARARVARLSPPRPAPG